MSNINLTASKETGYLVERGESKLLEYVLMYALIAIAFVLGVKVYVGEFKYETGPTEKTLFIVLFVLVLLLTALSLYQIKLTKKLIFIGYTHTKEEARKALRNLAKEQRWKINYDNQEYFKAFTKSGVVAGKEITIIYATNGVYTNVRLEYGLRGRFPFTFGKRETLELLKKRI
ncbi:hypothetical protein [Algoriphagus aquimarinus]|uniref:Uncharacterized protein n=1 Tax=Algoriphagus aquimarinus TaxID=237018 RepID=A0A1I1AA64_9BACT|nr:hypothetical protein [Algoriphagus aquimarinus]SFB33388.1 hypothetical protein SAMN04489723_107204 [Algoriphagus aquimarinus]